MSPGTEAHMHTPLGVFVTGCHRQHCERFFWAMIHRRKRTNLCCLLVLLCQLKSIIFHCQMSFSWRTNEREERKLHESHLLRTKKATTNMHTIQEPCKMKSKKISHMLDVLSTKAPKYKRICAKILQKFLASLAKEMLHV